MSVNKKAFQLAKSGATNAEIFGAIELTSAALSALSNSNPALIFSIIQGRQEFIQPLIANIEAVAFGWSEDMGAKPNLSALQLLLERADKANALLCSAYDIILLSGTSAPELKEKPSMSTVTQMLRVK